MRSDTRHQGPRQAGPARTGTGVVCVTVVGDYEVTASGVAEMLQPYEPRLRVVEPPAGRGGHVVDVALHDNFAQCAPGGPSLDDLLGGWAAKVVLFSWCHDVDLVERARGRGFAGFFSKGLGAPALAQAIERVHAGQFVVALAAGSSPDTTGRHLPGAAALTAREAQVVALVAQGHDNVRIAQLLLLSADGLKARIRSAYRKIGAPDRGAAVRWALTSGFLPGPPPRTSTGAIDGSVDPRPVSHQLQRSSRSSSGHPDDRARRPGGVASPA